MKVARLTIVVGAVATLSMLGVAIRASLNAAASEVQVARDSTVAALQGAARSAAVASAAIAAAQYLRVERDVALSRAEDATRRAATARVAFTRAESAAPDTCSAVVTAAHAALFAQDSVEQALRSALVTSLAVEQRLQLAVDTLGSALRRLRGAAAPLVVAIDKARPSRLARLARFLPRPGIGAAVGLDPLGQPRVVTGFQIGWSF